MSSPASPGWAAHRAFVLTVFALGVAALCASLEDLYRSAISHEWIARIKDSMKTNIPQFSTRRMVKEYVERLYVKALK